MNLSNNQKRHEQSNGPVTINPTATMLPPPDQLNTNWLQAKLPKRDELRYVAKVFDFETDARPPRYADTRELFRDIIYLSGQRLGSAAAAAGVMFFGCGSSMIGISIIEPSKIGFLLGFGFATLGAVTAKGCWELAKHCYGARLPEHHAGAREPRRENT